MFLTHELRKLKDKRKIWRNISQIGAGNPTQGKSLYLNKATILGYETSYPICKFEILCVNFNDNVCEQFVRTGFLFI